MFSQPDSSKISDQYTAVHLHGGDDLDDEGKAFMQRYGVGGYPTLLAMTPDGAVVSRSFQRTLDGILATMESAVTSNEEFKKSEAELSAKTDAESVRTLAGLYKQRSQLAKAREGYETLTKENPELADQEALLDILGSLSDTAARKTLLKKLVDTRAGHEKHIDWRIQHALADLPQQVTSREEFMEVMGKRKVVLETLLPTVKEPMDQAAVRGMLAQTLANTGDREGAEAHFSWILENAPKSKAAAGALGMKGESLINLGLSTGDPSKLVEAKALWEQLVKDHPENRMAQRAARLLPRLEGLIAELEAKKAAEEAAKKDAEKKADDEKEPEEKKDGIVPATPIR